MNKKLTSELVIVIILVITTTVYCIVLIPRTTPPPIYSPVSSADPVQKLQNNTFNLQYINTKAKSLFVENDIVLKNIIVIPKNDSYLIDLNYSTDAKVFSAYYNLKDSRFDDFGYVDVNKGDMDKIEADRILASPEVPQEMIDFGLEGALNKLGQDGNYIKLKQNNPDVFSQMNAYLEYEKAYGWVWKIMFFAGQISESNLQNDKAKTVIFWVTPNQVSVNKSINVLQ